MSRKFMVAGNWKMNGSLAANADLMRGLVAGVTQCPDVEVLVCPPAPYLTSVAQQRQTHIKLGAQDLSEQAKPGAFTGEIFGGMLKEVGCEYVIVGHSERRAMFGDTDERVALKFQTAQTLQLIPILCLGETLQDRESDHTEMVLRRQLAAVIELCGAEAFSAAVIAYEPVWAIGTGRTASPQQAQQAHAFIRSEIAARSAKIANSLRILYGGSVKADNAQELFGEPDVDGGLIGGASLKAADFLAICAAAQMKS